MPLFQAIALLLFAALPLATQASDLNLAAEAARSGGTGRFKAEMITEPSLPTQTIYRPRNMAAVGKLPILVWGNGSCANFGNRFRYFLTELASHGYLVVAIGPIGPAAYESADSIPNGRPAGTSPPPGMKRETRYTQLIEGIDWAIGQNNRRGSPYFHRLDTSKIAVMGQSCGGLQAILASADLRVKASIIFNSGTFPDGSPPTDGAEATRDSVRGFHAPVAYISGDETDIAFANANADFDLIDSAPAVRIYAHGVGHHGTYRNVNGGIFAPVALAWLDWQLKGSTRGARWFVGANCRLCSDPVWSLHKKGID